MVWREKEERRYIRMSKNTYSGPLEDTSMGASESTKGTNLIHKDI